MGQENGEEKIGRSHAAIKVRSFAAATSRTKQLCHMWEKTLGVAQTHRDTCCIDEIQVERKYRSNWISLSHYFQHVRKTEER